MSNSLFSDGRPNVAAMAEAAFGRASRAQQVLLSGLFSTAQTQFSLSRGLLEDMVEAAQSAAPAGNAAEAAQMLFRRVHDRTEQALTDMREINDSMRQGLYEAMTPPRSSPESAASVAPAPVAMKSASAAKN